jgi:hypothetical protein
MATLIRLIKPSCSIDKYIFHDAHGSDVIHNEIIKFNVNLSLSFSAIDKFLRNDLLGKEGYKQLDIKNPQTQTYHGECTSTLINNFMIKNRDYSFSEIGVDIHQRDILLQKKSIYGVPRGNIEIKYVSNIDQTKQLVLNIHLFSKDGTSSSIAHIKSFLQSGTLGEISKNNLEAMTVHNFQDYGYSLANSQSELNYNAIMQSLQQPVQPLLMSQNSQSNSAVSPNFSLS